MSLHYEARRVLIWGKTYPELSAHHTETVCTGGRFEDGSPVRLYPVPFRYLTGPDRYRLYSWIEVPVARSAKDPRPESRKIRPDQLRVRDWLGTEQGWAERRRVIFRNSSWHFGCLDDLRVAQQESRRSLGMVRVGSVDDVALESRPPADERRHAEKLASIKERSDLFDAQVKDLAYVSFRVRIRWRCDGGSRCPGHSASVLDWGLIELGRREGANQARRKMEDLADVSRFDLHLYMGNLFRRPWIFTCIGMWYPLRSPASSQGQLDLD